MAKLSNQVSDSILKHRRTHAPRSSQPLFALLESAEKLRAPAELLMLRNDDEGFETSALLLELREDAQGIALLLSHGMPSTALALALNFIYRLHDACQSLGLNSQAADELCDEHYDRRLQEVQELLSRDELTESEQELIRRFIRDYKVGGGLEDEDDEAAAGSETDPGHSATASDTAEEDGWDKNDDFDEDEEDEAEAIWEEYSRMPGNLRWLLNLLEIKFNRLSLLISDSGFGVLTESDEFNAAVIEKHCSPDFLAAMLCDSLSEAVSTVLLPLSDSLVANAGGSDEQAVRQSALLQLAFTEPAAFNLLTYTEPESWPVVLRDFRSEFAMAGLPVDDDPATMEMLQDLLKSSALLRWLSDVDLGREMRATINRLDASPEAILEL